MCDVARAAPTVFVDYVCVTCERRQTIQRKAGFRRAQGHLKVLWCATCLARVNHRQLDED